MRLDPGLFQVYFNLGVAYVRAGRYAEAVSPLESFLKSQPLDMRARELLGICLVESGDYARGIVELERVGQAKPSQAKPNEVSVLYALAAAHIRAGDQRRGQELLEKLEALEAQPAQVHLLKGYLYYRAEQWANAEKEYRRALMYDRNSAAALAAIGRLYLRTNEDASAIEYLEKALKLTPADAQSIYQLGVLLARNGQTSRGKTLLQQAIELRANYPDPMYALAKIELQEGHPQAALRLLQKAAAVAPNFESIRLLLACTYQALGDSQRAEAEFAAVRRLEQARLTRDRKRIDPEHLLDEP